MTFGIESSNIVGYTATGVEKGKFKICNAPFEDLAGGMNIGKLVTGFQAVDIDWDDEATGGGFMNLAAQIQIANAEGGYDVYYYVSNGYYEDAEHPEGDFKEGWCNADWELVTDQEFTPGEGFWVKDVPGEGTLNIAGAVVSDDVVSIECPTSFKLRGNAFPIEIKINGPEMTSDDIVPVEIDWDDEATGGGFMDTASQIQVANAEGGYDVYYYVSNGYYEDAEHPDGDFKAGWCNADWEYVEGDTIPVGIGFWTKGVSGAFTLKFSMSAVK